MRQRNSGFVGHAGQHDVVQSVELVLETGDDTRMPVAEYVCPPRADRIEIAIAVLRVQPGTFGPLDGEHGHDLVIMHLRARMPDHAKIARGK